MVKFREMKKAVKAEGWRLARIKGSHHIYIHEDSENLIILTKHSKDIDPRIADKILKAAKQK